LFGFTEKAYLNRMTNELKKLPDAIRGLISEIYWNPTDGNKNKIMLYMNDGFVVDGVIRRFADRMEAYPSIVSQLDSKTRGIVHIGVGAYFESNRSEEHTSELQSRFDLVCRLLLEKKKRDKHTIRYKYSDQ